jgi:hypothetical protein
MRCPHNFLLLRARCGKSRPRFAFVFRHTSDDAFDKWVGERHIPMVNAEYGIL